MNKNYIFILLLIFSIPSMAQWSTNPAVNNVISDLSGEQVIPKVGICPDGNIYIGFFSNVSGFYNVRLQKLDNQGNELWAHNGILISDHPTDSWVTDWDMAVDINNHAVLTFCDTRNGGNLNTVAYRISPDGTFVWGADGIALSNNTGFNAAPKVTCTAAGNAVFAWTSDEVIIMQKINAAGVKQWGADGITLTSVNSLSWPQLMPVGADEVILKYFDDAGSLPYPTRHIYAQRYNSSGSPIWASPTVISNAGGIASWNQIFPFINDGSDGFYITWHDDRDNNMLSSTFVQHVNSAGQVQFTANGVEASTQAGRNHFYPQLALPPGSSDIFVFWNEMNGDQNLNGISGQKISSAGTVQWTSSGMTFIPLSATTITPEAAECSATDMAILYSEGNSAASSLKAMRIGTDGSFMWPSQSITISSAASSKVHTVMSRYASDQWIVSWEDNRTDANDVYAQNFSIAGTLGPYEIVFGHIQGNVTLNGGTGNITQVVVSAGNNSTFPDPTGDYILQVQTGTYDVIASLNGYYPDTVSGVVVLEDQTTNNIDLELLAVPTTGYIDGMVELADGTGDVTQTIVSAGAISTNPDATGHYSMEVGVGTWDVQATLEGYTPQIRSNVAVAPGETTYDIDFMLSLLPTTGFLYGTVTIEGNMADVTQATVTAGTASVHPDENGDYLMELPVGMIDVTAGHPYTEEVTSEVNITPGGSIPQDFNLSMLRRDLICKVYQYPTTNPLLGSVVHLEGPEGSYDGTLETDSLVFPQVPYGHYTGEASFVGEYFDNTDTTIDQTNDQLVFSIIVSTAKSILFKPLSISPNPVAPNGILNFQTDDILKGTLCIFDSFGRKVSEISLDSQNQPFFPVTLLFNKQEVHEGIYFLHLVSGNDHFNAKLLIKK